MKEEKAEEIKKITLEAYKGSLLREFQVLKEAIAHLEANYLLVLDSYVRMKGGEEVK